MWRASLGGLILVVVIGLPAWHSIRGLADENGQQENSASSTATQRKSIELPPFTPENEAAALAFVEKHHAELGGVLTRLAGLDRQQYEQAIRELCQTTVRLSHVQTTNPDLYELMLQHWKLQSDIEILAARLACLEAPNADLEAKLLSLITAKVDLEHKTVEYNRDRMQEKVDALNRSIQSMKEHREQVIQRRFNIFKNSARRSAARSVTTPKPKTPAKQPPSTPVPPGTLDAK